MPDTASQTNGAERGASEQSPRPGIRNHKLMQCSCRAAHVFVEAVPATPAYLYPEDLTKLRQLSGYASAEHGIRVNDSMMSELRFLNRDGCPISTHSKRRRSVGSKANQPTDLIIRKKVMLNNVRTIHA